MPYHRLRFVVLSTLLIASAAPAAELCSVRSGAQTVPLVELYTSEGCSSCPPADRWLTQRVRSEGDAVNWLAFHVDYWDDLGWPDRFASAQYTERQRQRVGAHGDTTVYTPQVMVGEKMRTQWHSDASFARALANARTPATVGLALSLHLDAGKLELRLGAARVEGRAATPATLWLAEAVDGQITDVRAGENGGVRLRHDRVVRKLWGPWPLGTAALSQRVQVPAGSSSADFTAFVQDGQGRTLQSLKLSNECWR
jgi:hypothetical protein